MSNVLIGIIAVILFIGLALASALILGDDFLTASSSSQAAGLMAQMKQVADAAELYKLKTGARYVPAIETDFLLPRFLGAAASNPTSAARTAPTSRRYQHAPHFSIWTHAWDFEDATHDGRARHPERAAGFVIAVVGTVGDGPSRAVCQAIAETSETKRIVTEFDERTQAPPGLTGCMNDYLYDPAIGDYVQIYLAWRRIEGDSFGYVERSGYAGS